MLTRTRPLRRKTPLRSLFALPRNAKLRPASPTARARQRMWTAMTRRAIQANGGRCAVGVEGVCLGAASEGHHRRPRSQGGTDTPDNVVPCCRRCHSWVHDHPRIAYERGYLLRREGGAR